MEMSGAFSAYLLLAVLIWWKVWSTHPSGTGICGCGDPSLFFWAVGWPAHALAHGLDPFYSKAMLYPNGVNLLSNTGVLAIGIPLAPVTWLFGPVATVNVASVLAPTLSATAMYWALRRWVLWKPAAFLGALFYGFSPFVLYSLGNSYLTLSFLAIPPLLLGCLDELLVRQRRSSRSVGAIIGVLLAVQFFVSTEVLLMTVVVTVVGILILGVFALTFARHELLLRISHAGRGIGVALLVSGVLLGFPIWFAVAGPGHLAGAIWSDGYVAEGRNPVAQFWHLLPPPTGGLANLVRIFGWYQGSTPLVEPAYLGAGLIAVAIVGWAIWWRDKLLWFFGTLGLIAAVFSTGSARSSSVLWRPFSNLPLLQNIVPGRFSIYVDLCGAALLALASDHTFSAFNTRRAPDLWSSRPFVVDPARSRHPHRVGPSAPVADPGLQRNRRNRPGGGRLWKGLAWTSGLAVTAIALVPVARAEAPNLPLTVVHIDSPGWFSTVAPHLRGEPVVLTYPFASSGIQSPMVWEAIAGMPYQMVGGGGPGGSLSRTGIEHPGAVVLDSLSEGVTAPPAINQANVDAVRNALRSWGVTMIVIPDQSSLRLSERGRDPGYALQFFTRVLENTPTRQDGAWVWMEGP
jgi:hypothetical protein